MEVIAVNKLTLTPDEWGLNDYDGGVSNIRNEILRDLLNFSMSLSIEYKDKTIIEHVMNDDKWKDWFSNESFDVKNGIWCAKFGADSYEGFIDPTYIKKWADKLGYSPLLPLRVTAKALVEWAEGIDAPNHLTKAVRRGLDEDKIHPSAENDIGIE